VSTGYAGIESMSVPISCTKENLDWDQYHQAMEWIGPKILNVQGFLFNSTSCWEKLGNLLTRRCQVLRLEVHVPLIYRCFEGRVQHATYHYSGDPKDTIYPYRLSTVTSPELLVLQKAPNIHHMSIHLPAGLLLPVHGVQVQDAEMSFIDRLGMSNLTSLHLVRNEEDELFDGEDPEEIFRGWARYWAKEGEVWVRLAEGLDALIIDLFTSQMEESKCESKC
jgi:hypothetical protein